MAWPSIEGEPATEGVPPTSTPAEPPATETQAEPRIAAAAASASGPASSAVAGPAGPPPTRATPRGIRASGAGLEQRLGTHLPVWVGAIALALSGVFLVQYTIEQGWLGETVRVTLGVLFGVALVGLAEFLRSRVDSIASGLAAAGIAVLLASFLAATELYGLIPSAAGFTLMGLAAAAGVGLSLRHGRIVALVGLVGGFLTPYLIHDPDAASALAVFGYFLLLQLAVLAVTRRRGWVVVGARRAGCRRPVGALVALERGRQHR